MNHLSSSGYRHALHLRFLLLLSFLFLFVSGYAQRQTENLDRGVMAMAQSSSQLFVSWRYLVTDPEDIGFNVYANGAKLNSKPITNSTNLLASVSTTSNMNITVRPVIGGVEGTASEPFAYKSSTGQHRIVQDFNFKPMEDGLKYNMKFCWPADLDGDGAYDYVMDRQNYGATASEDETGTNSDNYPTPKVEAYKHDGTFLWRIDMGPNVQICNGHDDMVVAYDMDGDGKAEVLMKTSEGTRFADGKMITDDKGKVTDTRGTTTVPPHYISVVNGMTGVEMARIEMPNKSYREKSGLYNTWHYRSHNGHFGIAYFDGIRPSLVFEYSNRNSDKSFNTFVTAWDYRNGVLSERFNWVVEGNIYNDFHQIRIADVDGDGCDEMIEGGFVVDHTGKPLFGTELCHGDRHRTTDIDPDRPGLETFAIQQNNPTTLGMALYDAATGEFIKKWYMNGVGDVGRGECIDMDETSRGLEMYSTMRGYYDAKGNLLVDSESDFPAEPIWWDGDLGREVLAPIGSSGANIDIKKWNSSTKTMGRYMYKNKPLYNEKSSYYTMAQYGGRPAFIGDILGDWREELLLMRRDSTGFCILSTWDVSDHRIYCLMQNPGYRMQATTKGYYQSPYTDYYLAYDMPDPQIAPVMKSDLFWTGAPDAVWQASGSGFAASASDSPQAYADGRSVMFDLRGGDDDTLHVAFHGNLAPEKVWLMNPRGKDYVFEGDGVLTGSMPLVKSQQGTVLLPGAHTYTGETRISEGTLKLNGSLQSKVRVQARGVLAGNAVLKGGMTLEEGLNTAGGRLEPGLSAQIPGKLTVQGDVAGAGRNTFAFDMVPAHPSRNDSILVEGGFSVTGNDNTIVVTFADGKPVPGTYTLISSTGAMSAQPSQFAVSGLDGVPYTLSADAHNLRLTVESMRAPGKVQWMGNLDNIWDFKTKNFVYGGGSTVFATGDTVLLTSAAATKQVVLSGVLPVGGVVMDGNSDYTLSGTGSISGKGSIVKQGTATLKITGTEHTYTGKTEIRGGVLEVNRLAVAGEPSSIGAASADAGNFVLADATLRVLQESATDRRVTLVGQTELNIPDKNVYANFRGSFTGTGQLMKTGAGQVTVSAANSHTGGTVLRSGTILLGTYEANVQAFPTGITLEDGTLRMYEVNNMSQVGPAAWNLTVPEGKSATLVVPSRFDMTGALLGGGNLTISIPYVRAEMKGDWSAFTGNLYVTGSTGEFRLRNAAGLAGATVWLQDKALLHYPTTAPSGEVPVGMLNGVANSSLSAASSKTITWAVGGNGQTGKFDGTIKGDLKMVKRGEGTWTLTGDNTYSGSTTVAAGRLMVRNTSGSATGTGDVTVNSGAVVAGTGTIGGSLTVSGTLQPGADAVGTLTVEKNLTLTTGSVYEVELSKTSVRATSDQVVVKGKLTWGGTLSVRLLAGSFKAGDELVVATAASFAGSVKVLPEAPAEGLLWDTSELLHGVLKVVEDPAVIDNPPEGDDPSAWQISLLRQPVAPSGRLCSGDKATLQVTAEGKELKYQWYRDGAPVSGATGTAYSASVSGTYKARVYNGHQEAWTSNVTVTISAVPSVNLTGRYSTLTAAALPSGTAYTYRWFLNDVLWKETAAASCTVTSSGNWKVEVVDNATRCSSMSSSVRLSGVTPADADLRTVEDVFPNPVKDVFSVDLQVPADLVELFDMNGSLVARRTSLPEGRHAFDLSGRPAGVYVLRITSEDGVSMKKIVKE